MTRTARSRLRLDGGGIPLQSGRATTTRSRPRRSWMALYQPYSRRWRLRKAALVNDTGEAWARFESCVSPHVRTALPPAAWSVLEEAVSGALDAVRLKAGDALTDLAESCKQRARMQLKEQAANFESKLETARRARMSASRMPTRRTHSSCKRRSRRRSSRC